MNLKAAAFAFAGLAIVGTAHAQSLPFATSSNLFRPDIREFATSAALTEWAPTPHEVPLAAFTITNDVNHSRQLLVTLGSNPPPALKPALTSPLADVRGEALVSMHLRFATR